MIRPEQWSKEQFVELSPNARLLYIGLWNFSDDGGNHPASVKSAKMEIFPGDDLTAAAISGLIEEIKKQNLITQYEAQNAQYWHINNWENLQTIEKKTYQHPPFADRSPNGRRAVGENQQAREVSNLKASEREHTPAHEEENSSQNAAPTFDQKTNADTPAQLVAQLAAFYHAHPTEWQQSLLETSGGKNYPEPKLREIIQKFAANRIEKNLGRETYAAQNAALQKWMADQPNHENRPAPNGKTYNGKNNEYPITDHDTIRTYLKNQHPAAAARFTKANIETLAKAPNEASFAEWANNIAKKILNGWQEQRTNGNATPTTIGDIAGKIITKIA